MTTTDLTSVRTSFQRLADRAALITGSTGGIGEAIANAWPPRVPAS